MTDNGSRRCQELKPEITWYLLICIAKSAIRENLPQLQQVASIGTYCALFRTSIIRVRGYTSLRVS